MQPMRSATGILAVIALGADRRGAGLHYRELAVTAAGFVVLLGLLCVPGALRACRRRIGALARRKMPFRRHRLRAFLTDARQTVRRRRKWAVLVVALLAIAAFLNK